MKYIKYLLQIDKIIEFCWKERMDIGHIIKNLKQKILKSMIC